MDALATILDYGLLLLAGGSLIGSWIWQRSRLRKTATWPIAEATIESGTITVITRGEITAELPVFEISYRVGEAYFGGRFALRPYITDPGSSIVNRMIGRKFTLRYDPHHPHVWFIPDRLIEGCRIEQKLSPYFVNLRPKD